MASDAPLPDSSLPVKVDAPDVSAPPTLAEPESGHAANIPGAQTDAMDEERPATDASKEDTNGSAQPAASDLAADASTAPSDNKPSSDAPAQAGAKATSQANESQEANETNAGAVDDEPTEANGDASAKKGSNGKRKSTGVAEPKGKKLTKKKSVAKITHLDAKPGEHYFARLKSYPPWPAVICDEEILPSTLLNTRPITTKRVDGSYNEAYADGGKKVNERTFPVMFLATNEFAWIPNTDLAELDPESCKDTPAKGKSKALHEAYQVAAEGHDLAYYKQMLLEHAQYIEEEEAAKREAAEAKAQAKAEKKKRKSEPKVKAADEDVDMEDADEPAEPKKSSKKRKKAAESDDEETEKPAKTPKTTKLKLTTGKTPTTTEKKQKEKPAKKGSRKSKAAADEDEDMADAPDSEEATMMREPDPAAVRKAREREVLYLRHKLQKGFLTRDQAPVEADMPEMSGFIKKLEDYGDDIEVNDIRTTKINKVLKALVKLNTIPKDEEFQFRKRSVDLLAKWNKLMGAEPQEADSKGEDGKETSKSTPATNGVHDDTTEGKEEAKENKDAPAPAPDADQGDKAAAPSAEPVQPSEEAKPSEPEPTAAAEKPLDAPVTEESKTSAPVDVPAAPETSEKAPESAEAAAEATEAVKASE